MDEEFFTIQTYTPGSDLAVGFNPSQIILGRSGNDTVLGDQPTEDSADGTFIDVLIGDLALDDPAFRSWNDTFILGDWSRPYYDNGDPSVFGLNDFGFIGDFNLSQDTIQLNGNPEDYQLLDVGVGTAILLQQDTPDVVGFIFGDSNLDLESDYFQFEGSTPPPGPVQEAQQLGTSGFDLPTGIATDPFEDVYVAGGTTGSLEGENAGLRDALIAKYDSQGELINTIQFGSEDFDTAYGVATDDEGNFYITGTTEGDLAAPKQADTSDVIIAKYDRDGDRQWIRQFGFEEDLINQGLSIDADAEGNAYISGIRVKPSPEDIATDDFFVAKYDTNGNQEWFTEVGVDDIPGTIEDFDESYGVAVSDDGHVYATGWTFGDLAAENAGLYDVWLGQFDGDDGELNWLQQLGTEDYEWSWAVDTDSEGNAYATGWTLGDLGGENAGSYDVWLAKYDEQGNQQWLRQFGSSGDEAAFDINIDSDDKIFLTGYTNSDLGGENAGSFDAWVAQYDTDGNQVDIEQFGTPDFDQAYGITTNSAGNVYFTGVTDGSFGELNAGSFDIWLASLDSGLGS